MVSEQIQIVIKDGEKTVKIKLPPKISLLEKSLRILHNQNESNVVEKGQYECDDDDYPLRTSKELAKNKKFKESFNRAVDEFGDRHFTYCKFTNIVEISPNKKEIPIKYTLDREEWKKLLPSLFADIIREKVESVILHVSSKISDEEKGKIIDDVFQLLYNVPLITSKSERKSKSTLVEIFFFGRDIIKCEHGVY